MSQPASSKTANKVKYDNHQFASEWHRQKHLEGLEYQADMGRFMDIVMGIVCVVVLLGVGIWASTL